MNIKVLSVKENTVSFTSKYGEAFNLRFVLMTNA